MSSIVKGLAANLYLKGNGNYLDSKQTGKIDAGIAESAGLSFCLADGTGGKLVANSQILVNMEINEDLIRKVELAVKNSEQNLKFLDEFFKISIDVGIYSDSGKLTASLLKTESFADLMDFSKKYIE